MATATPVRANNLLTVVLLLTACLVPAVACAYERGASGNDSSTMPDFKIVIPSIVRLRATQQMNTFTIEPRDVAQGYVDLHQATSLSLTRNSKLGCDLSIVFDSSLISRVAVRNGIGELQVAPSAVSLAITHSWSDSSPTYIGYRLYLRGNAVAGDHPWPMSLNFTCRRV